MTAYVSFPAKFINKTIVDEIISYYSLTDTDHLVSLLESPVVESNMESIIQELDHLSEDIYPYNGMISLYDSAMYDDERMHSIESALKGLKVPFNTTQGNELRLYQYRPELSDTMFEIINHPNLNGKLITIEEVVKMIDATPENLDLREIMMKNLEKKAYPVPDIHSYVGEKLEHFVPTGLKDLRLLA